LKRGWNRADLKDCKKQFASCFKKYGPESTELQERVRKITDETALDTFIEELIVADNINDAAKVIEALN
jgi:hypothetical protein